MSKTTSSLDLHYDENDIHNELLADLITGYFGKYGKTKGNVVRWKMHFRKYCPLPSQQECSVMENFDYLERSGLIAVGKYDVLENIFRFVDERALCNIKDASQMINAIKSTSSDARANGYDFFAEIIIKMSRRCLAIEQQLTYILNNFVIDLEDALSPRFQLPPFYFIHQSRICPIETGLKIMKGTERPDRFPHIWKTTNSTLKTLTNFISNYNKDASRSSRIIVQTLLMFLYNLKQKYNVKRWRFLWNEYMVISVEFDNPFDLRAFLRCSYLLREDTRDSFHLIFDHVNDIRLAIPYIEIRNASIQNSPWRSQKRCLIHQTFS